MSDENIVDNHDNINNTIDQFVKTLNSQIDSLRIKYEKKMQLLKDQYEYKLNTIQNQHHSELESLENIHSSQLLLLKDSHRKEIQNLKTKHEKAMDVQTSSLSSFTLVQGMSREVMEYKKKFEVSESQLKLAKKQLAELKAQMTQSKESVQLSEPQVVEESKNKSTEVMEQQDNSIKKSKLQLKVRNTTVTINNNEEEKSSELQKNQESSNVSDLSRPNIEAKNLDTSDQIGESTSDNQLKESTNDDQSKESIPDNGSNQSTTENTSTEPIRENQSIKTNAEQLMGGEEKTGEHSETNDQINQKSAEHNEINRKNLSKIKVKGQIYYLNKQPESNGDQLIYECLDQGNIGQIVGRKTSDNKYRFTK